MIWHKSCPRCHGDLTRDEDMYGHYVACIQCGYYLMDADQMLLGIVTVTEGLYSLAIEVEEKVAV